MTKTKLRLHFPQFKTGINSAKSRPIATHLPVPSRPGSEDPDDKRTKTGLEQEGFTPIASETKHLKNRHEIDSQYQLEHKH